MFVRFRQSHQRLKVYIVENARLHGKVKQITIAYLGSAPLPADDEREAIAARIAFWNTAGPKLKNLLNRLGGETEVRRLRLIIHTRIPWPMEPERQRFEALKAEHEAKFWHGMYQQTGKMIEANERLAAKAAEQNKELRRDALQEIARANELSAKAQALKV